MGTYAIAGAWAELLTVPTLLLTGGLQSQDLVDNEVQHVLTTKWQAVTTFTQFVYEIHAQF